MNIVNICNKVYTDNWGYQENILPVYEAKMGHRVSVIASANHFPSYVSSSLKEEIKSKGKDYHIGDVVIHRRNTYIETGNLSLICSGIYRILKKEAPNIIFHHNINPSSLIICFFYCIFNSKCKLFVDNHADSINESTNKIINYIIKSVIIRIILRIIDFKIVRYYGVTPARCSYLKNVYGVREKKISLLPIGCDTDEVEANNIDVSQLSELYHIPENSFIICSGGKMGRDKGTNNLINAFVKFHEETPTAALLLFGKFEDEETSVLANQTSGVYFAGWCDRTHTIGILKNSNLAVWPVHHTTLIEDAISCQTPIIVRRTGNTSHLIKGNGEFVETGSVDELNVFFHKIKEEFPFYKKNAYNLSKELSYVNIVERLICDYKKF